MRHSPLRAIARKEFIQIQRDRATIYMVFVFPLMMLVLYGFGIRYDVKSVPVTVLDRDETPQTRQYIERFAHSPYFTIKRYAKAYRDLQEDIDRGETRIGLVIPPDFTERLSSNREATVQVVVDGTDNNTATIAMSYVTAITQDYSSAVVAERMMRCCAGPKFRFRRSRPNRASGSIPIWKVCSSSSPALSRSS